MAEGATRAPRLFLVSRLLICCDPPPVHTRPVPKWTPPPRAVYFASARPPYFQSQGMPYPAPSNARPSNGGRYFASPNQHCPLSGYGPVHAYGGHAPGYGIAGVNQGSHFVVNNNSHAAGSYHHSGNAPTHTGGTFHVTHGLSPGIYQCAPGQPGTGPGGQGHHTSPAHLTPTCTSPTGTRVLRD